MGAKADAIDAAQVLIDNAKAAINALLDGDVRTAYAAMDAAEAMPDDPVPPEPVVMRTILNDTGYDLTLTQLDADNQPVGAVITIENHSSAAVPSGTAVLVASEVLTVDLSFVVTSDRLVTYDSGNGVLVQGPLLVTLRAVYPHHADWGVDETVVNTINGLAATSGNLLTLDEMATWVGTFLGKTCVNESDVTLAITDSTNLTPVTIHYTVTHESLPEYDMTLEPVFNT